MPGKTVEQIYIKKEQKQHIKDCPDTYVGSIEKKEVNLWTFDEETKMMQRKNINIIPALYKIFDEVLVNVYDHYIRCRGDKSKDPVTIIKVNVDVEKNEISIYNNGSGIPIVMHTQHKKYIPELIFGDLMTSSNYDKNEKKITGGKNGFGAKLANIFSTNFTVETVDEISKKKYIQEFKKNMDVKGKANISKSSAKPYVKITFRPDFNLLGMGETSQIDTEMISLFKRRVYDMTACTDSTVTVYWNNDKIGCKSFEKYVEMYIGTKSKTPRVHEICNDRWEVIVCPSDDNNLEHVSFVNGISTFRGGEHVDYVSTQVARKINNFLKKKKGNKIVLKESHIKDNMMLFLKCSIENPSFSSQTKEHMTTVLKNFGSKCNLSDQFIDRLSKIGIIEKAQKLGEFKDSINMDKMSASTGKRRVHIPKYEPANWAGTSKSKECILILTEGDSAKSSVESGFNVVSRDRFGIFPLRGKLLNVREAGIDKLMKNEEIKHIREIMGLQFYKKGTKEKMVYDENLTGLNYGHIMIMTDQDVDGSHIKGLLINFIEYFWPTLLAIPGFLTSFKTPVLIATKKGGGKNKEKIAFFNLTNYENWRKEVNLNQWNIKYYKGLGTSNRTDFQEYFQNYDNHYIEFNDEDESGKEAIDKVFNQKRADDRKEWIGNYDKNIVVDPSVSQLTFADFFNMDMIHFSVYDCIRSIPNMCDGLKPSQRKVMHTLLKRRARGEIKVAQLSGMVAGETDYHHGEVSLMACIINMAQDFVGSNNINLLHPEGQFGTRRQGGKDSASARYIYTYLAPITRTIYHDDDLPLLKYTEDDNGRMIEPEWFLPILPMVLINGTEGVGTGYSTFIATHNPEDVVANIRRMLDGDDPKEMAPWFRGFTGKIERKTDVKNSFKTGKIDDKYYTYGKVTKIGKGIYHITELPVGTWTESYREYLDSLIIDKTEKNASRRNKQCLMDFWDNSTDTRINFKVKFLPSKLENMEDEKIEQILKMSSSNQTKETFMHMFNAEHRMTKYENTLDILKAFYHIRIQYYQKRKDYLLGKYKRDLDIIKEKTRFIEYFIDKKIKLINQTDEVIVQSLEEHNFLKLNDNNNDNNDSEISIDNNHADGDGGDDEDNAHVKNAMKSYNYLTSMSIRTLTKKRIDDLKKQRNIRQTQYDEIDGKTREQLWIDDLDNFEVQYQKMMADWEERMSDLCTSASGNTNSGNSSKSKGKKIKKIS